MRHTHYDKASLASAADAVICPAESVRADVIELLGLPEDRVFTVPARPSAADPARDRDAVRGRSAVMSSPSGGAILQNFLGVLPGLAPVLRRTGLSLVCAGGGPFTVESARP